MDSWTLDEYHIAWEHGFFVDLINNEEELLLRYYFAGGSCRNFVYRDLENLVARLNIDITRINDCALLLSGLQGEANANAVNALMQRFGDEMSIVSEYVVKALSKKVDMEFVNSASRVMTANPVWQGWVFELRFFVLCKTHAVDINLKHPKESLLWEKFKILEVKDAEYIDKGTLSNKTWIFPKWNQSCFDALYFHEF